MRHADGRLIAIIERTTYSCMTGKTKPKCSIFSMQARLKGTSSLGAAADDAWLQWLVARQISGGCGRFWAADGEWSAKADSRGKAANAT